MKFSLFYAIIIKGGLDLAGKSQDEIKALLA